MKKKPIMRVIALANGKGGVGKTTLSAQLAVRAAEDGRVAMIDCDDQESLSAWWERRHSRRARARPSSALNPKLFENVDATTETIELIASEGWDWIIIDTPPLNLDRIEPAIHCCDLALIPVSPSLMDLEQIGVIEDLCAEHNKPFAYVVGRVDRLWRTDAEWRKLTQSALDHLRDRAQLLKDRAQLCKGLLEPFVIERAAYIAGMTAGKSAVEVDRDGKRAVKQEIDALWASVKQAVSSKPEKVRA